MDKFNFDDLDYRILGLIANNARISFLEVARICNVSGAAVHQRVQKMTGCGIITGSEIQLDLKSVGYNTCAFITLYLDSPGKVDGVVDRLMNIPEIVECHSVGVSQIMIQVYAKDNEHLYGIMHDKIAGSGIVRNDTVLSFKEHFSRQVEIYD
jgi:transcriptional regulator